MHKRKEHWNYTYCNNICQPISACVNNISRPMHMAKVSHVNNFSICAYRLYYKWRSISLAAGRRTSFNHSPPKKSLAHWLSTQILKYCRWSDINSERTIFGVGLRRFGRGRGRYFYPIQIWIENRAQSPTFKFLQVYDPLPCARWPQNWLVFVIRFNFITIILTNFQTYFLLESKEISQ